MKHTMHTKFLCYIFAMIFFIGGMTPVYGDTDSTSFCASNNTSPTTIISTKNSFRSPQPCTPEMLGHCNAVSITNISKDLNIHKYTASFFYVVPDALLELYTFHFLCKAELSPSGSKISLYYIMCYIHHKDGKKQISSNLHLHIELSLNELEDEGC